MAINFIPFDSTRPMSDAKKTTESSGVKSVTEVDKVVNEKSPNPNKRDDANDNTANNNNENSKVNAIKAKASKPNRRKRSKSKQAMSQDDFGLYSNRQDEEHHLIEEPLSEPEHKVDVKV
ncbi:MAG: hypothetical protein HWE27_18270 [Gammaproteobacteria bacterium]|nr:hypothetical protein [Gammaproteobacteria bacterium]